VNAGEWRMVNGEWGLIGFPIHHSLMTIHRCS